MFNRRTLEMRMVKTPRNITPAATPERKSVDIDAIMKIAERQCTRLAVAGVAVYAAVTVLSTASEIAINAAPKR